MITKKDLNNLEGLFLLTAVAQTSGKRQAAQALNTSVDTINKYLSDFENEMGTKLLNTNSRGSNLTPNGKKMLEHAHKIKMILENIYSERPSKTEIKGQVRVGIMLDISSVLLIDGLNDLFAHYPELTIVSISNNENLNGDMSYEVGLAFEKPTRNDNVILYTKELKYGFLHQLNIWHVTVIRLILKICSTISALLLRWITMETLTVLRICLTGPNT